MLRRRAFQVASFRGSHTVVGESRSYTDLVQICRACGSATISVHLFSRLDILRYSVSIILAKCFCLKLIGIYTLSHWPKIPVTPSNLITPGSAVM